MGLRSLLISDYAHLGIFLEPLLTPCWLNMRQSWLTGQRAVRPVSWVAAAAFVLSYSDSAVARLTEF